MKSQTRTLADRRLAGHNVSRETLERLEAFTQLLSLWNRRINLVSRSEAQDLWTRHIEDSARIYAHAPPCTDTWCDMGSGGGLPGLVCAILSRSDRSSTKFTLIESNSRKAAFLREAGHRLGLDIDVICQRIEATNIAAQDIISARALSDLSNLLTMAYRFCHKDTVMLFPKGRTFDTELTRARRDWHMSVNVHSAEGETDGVVLEIREVAPRQ